MKILMCAMALDIGGAETHVLELSRALCNLGHDVTVASNGGVFVAELEACGIRHVKIPLHTKAPGQVIKSYFALKKLIKKEKFDIVHAHARIPAFVCGLLCPVLNFRFVTTAHWVFDVNALWRKIAFWGEKTVAVSEDIKQYLVDSYGVYSDNISVTINGVDMEKFSPETPSDSVARELGLPEKRKTIVYVSRMDTDRSLVARQLCEIAPALKKKHPDLQVVVVGGGDDFEHVSALAKKANEASGEKFVHATGGRTDINNLVALGDLFVGVSRAALEAMSASKPVIVAGNEGYIGRPEGDMYDVAVATNFCCRGCDASSPERLLSDVSALLDLPDSELAEIGERNRAIIKENYSAERMARDCLAVYESLRPYEFKHENDVILSGYYGFGNMGDDSLLLSIAAQLRAIDPDVRITALTRDPKRSQLKYGVRCVNRLNVFAIRREMKRAKLLISGGGSLLQNNTSEKSLNYYIAIIKMAKRAGLPVMVYSNGIGPVYGDRSVEKVKKVLSEVDLISLREPSSLEFLRKIGLKTDREIAVTADPALTVKPIDDSRLAYLEDKLGIDTKANKYYALSVREYENLKTGGEMSKTEFTRRIASAMNEIHSRLGLLPIVVSVQNVVDLEISRAVCREFEKVSGQKAVLAQGLSSRELTALLSKTEFAVGMRLHMLIYATNACVPAIGIAYDPKISAFLEYSGHDEPLDMSSFTPEDILTRVERTVAERTKLCERIRIRQCELSELARFDAQCAMEFVKK